MLGSMLVIYQKQTHNGRTRLLTVLSQYDYGHHKSHVELNLNLHGEKLMTNCLSYGRAIYSLNDCLH